MKKIIALGVCFLASFNLAHAAVSVLTTGVTDVNRVANQLENYFNLGIELMIAASVAWIAWSAFQFVMSAGDEENRSKARSGIIYGIVGLVVMLSIWGLVGILLSSTGISTSRGNIVAPSTVTP